MGVEQVSIQLKNQTAQHALHQDLKWHANKWDLHVRAQNTNWRLRAVTPKFQWIISNFEVIGVVKTRERRKKTASCYKGDDKQKLAYKKKKNQ